MDYYSYYLKYFKKLEKYDDEFASRCLFNNRSAWDDEYVDEVQKDYSNYERKLEHDLKKLSLKKSNELLHELKSLILDIEFEFEKKYNAFKEKYDYKPSPEFNEEEHIVGYDGDIPIIDLRGMVTGLTLYSDDSKSLKIRLVGGTINFQLSAITATLNLIEEKITSNYKAALNAKKIKEEESKKTFIEYLNDEKFDKEEKKIAFAKELKKVFNINKNADARAHAIMFHLLYDKKFIKFKKRGDRTAFYKSWYKFINVKYDKNVKFWRYNKHFGKNSIKLELRNVNFPEYKEFENSFSVYVKDYLEKTQTKKMHIKSRYDDNQDNCE